MKANKLGIKKGIESTSIRGGGKGDQVAVRSNIFWRVNSWMFDKKVQEAKVVHIKHSLYYWKAFET
jgi:hypothetical protein